MTAVLFTCAGQRVDIISAFKAAGATTIAADANRLAPAPYFADCFELVPRVDDPAYVAALREIVERHDVKLIVPLTDLDQSLLARSRDHLHALVLLPHADVVESLNDKYETHVLLEEHGLPSPPTWLPTELPAEMRFPVLVKARDGFGSRHIYRAENASELEFFLRYSPVESCVQQLCRGEEFSIDVFCDWDGRCLNAIPRTMIESKGGESIKGQSIKDWPLIEFGRRVSETLGLVGPANVQCFRESDGVHYVTDINPRFGGGFPLPTAAGSRYPELAIAMARGERPEPRLGEFREGVTMTRFFAGLTLVADADGTLGPFDGISAPAEA